MEYLQAIEVLEKLHSLGSKRQEKEALLAANANNAILKYIFVLSYDWMAVYGIKVHEHPYYITDPATGSPPPVDEANWAKFVELLESFSRKEYLGSKARKQWIDFITNCSIREKFWFSRIINRDLRIGVAELTVAKTWPGSIPEFGCQLATSEPYDPTLGLRFPVWVEPKYDGLRMITVVNTDKAMAYTRNGKEILSMKRFADAIADSAPGDYVLDGEVFHTNMDISLRLAETPMDALTEEEKAALPGLTYFVFDKITLEEFQQKFSLNQLYIRSSRAEKIIRRVSADYKTHPNVEVKFTPFTIANSHEDIAAAYSKAMDDGFEGVMIKDPTAGYKFGRTMNWLKLKAEEVMEGKIIEIKEGIGRHIDALGSMKVEVEGEVISIHSGFKDSLRKEFWTKRDTLIGKHAEFKVQRDPNDPAVVRFSRFVTLKED